MKSPARFFEDGPGGRIIRLVTIVGLLLVLAGWLSLRQFQGPVGEESARQAIAARQLALGEGYTTTAVTPQAFRLLEREERPVSPNGPVPELYHAPGYPALVGLPLSLLPASLVNPLFEPVSGTAYSERYRGDLYLYAFNLAFFVLAIGLTYYLGARLFSRRAAFIAAAALIVSAGFWDEVLTVSGASLMASLVLGLFAVRERLDRAREARRSHSAGAGGIWIWSLVAGLLLALLYLTEYIAGFIALGYLLSLWLDRERGPVGVPLLVAGLMFLLAFGGWSVRNVSIAGNPWGLAGTEILYAPDGGPLADDFEAVQGRFSSQPRALGPRDIFSKGFAGIRELLSERLYASGSLLFGALFVASLFHSFRRPELRALRSLLLLSVVPVLLLSPFFQGGDSVREPAAWLAPLLVLFGAAFAVMLVESAGERTGLERWTIYGGLLLVQGLGLIHLVLAPARPPFNAERYLPPIYANLNRNLVSQAFFEQGLTLFSDSPAGISWYGTFPVMLQPTTYADFSEIRLFLNPGALFLTPARLDEPVSSVLAAPNEDEDYRRVWSDVYAGLVEGEMPSYFPFQQILPASNHYLISR